MQQIGLHPMNTLGSIWKRQSLAVPIVRERENELLYIEISYTIKMECD